MKSLLKSLRHPDSSCSPLLAIVALGLLVICAGITTAWGTTPPSMPASLPLKRDAATSAFPSVAGIIILTLIMVSAFVTLQILRRKGTTFDAVVTRLRRLTGAGAACAGSTQASIRLLSTVRLSPRVSLHVVQWENCNRLLACTDSGVTVLGESQVPPEVRPEVQGLPSTTATYGLAGH